MSIELAPKTREGRAALVLIPLLLLHLLLISLQVEDPQGVLLFKRWMLAASSPFLFISSTITGIVSTAWNNYIWLHGAREENLQLQDRLRHLALRDSALTQMKEENVRLQRLLALGESLPLNGIGARVIGRAPDYLSKLITIDRGWEDGIRADAPVVSADGALGRVVLLSRRSSQVQLISNPDAAVGVMLEKSRSPGVLKGTGSALLDLHYLSNTEVVQPDDKIITSGLDGVFPKGIPVGKVKESHKGKSVFRVVQVEPSADLVHIEEVLVLTGPPKPASTLEESGESN